MALMILRYVILLQVVIAVAAEARKGRVGGIAEEEGSVVHPAMIDINGPGHPHQR